MNIKERLKLMKEVEERNQSRIKAFLRKARKRRLNGDSEKAYKYRGDDKKHK